MNRRMISYSLGAAAVAFGMGACSSDSSTAPGGVTGAEIAASNRQDAGEGAAFTVSELAANDAFIGATANVIKGGGSGSPAADLSVSCTGPDGMGWYTCTAVTEFGLTVVRQIRFWEGTAYGLAWNPGVTDSVNHAWTASGTVNSVARPGKVWTIDDAASGTMRVLPTAATVNPQHSWSGSADRHESSSYTMNSVERTFDHTAHDVVDQVVFQMPRSQNPYPLSGTITRNSTNVFTAGSFTRTVMRMFVVTFNGTHIAQLMDGALTCDLDLDTGLVSNCH